MMSVYSSPDISLRYDRGKPRKTSARRTCQYCATSHRLICVPVPPNEVGRIAQLVIGSKRDVWKGKRNKAMKIKNYK